MDKEEIFDIYLDEHKMHSFEGERGIEHLNQIAQDLGYREDGFKYGSALERFLQDNSGACEALVEWIKEHASEEQLENFKFDECEEEEVNS